MIQRIYSKALFLKENESPSIAEKILKIMNIMREGEEFYIEESSGVLAALLVEIARLNRASPEDRVEEETGKLTNMITRVLDLFLITIWKTFGLRIWRRSVTSVKLISEEYLHRI